MKQVITKDNLSYFAYVNSEYLCGAPRGIVISFMGLGGVYSQQKEPPRGERFGAAGLLFVVPYLDPWNWMNRRAVETTDAIISALLDLYGLSSLPVVSTGGSMGGLNALTYCCYAARTPVACVASCPVCDLVYHYTERPDLPPTLLAAYSDVDAPTLDDALATASPYHLARAGKLPQIPYTIYHSTGDPAVNMARHSSRLEEAMRGKYCLTFVPVPSDRHCSFPEDFQERYTQAILNAVPEA